MDTGCYKSYDKDEVDCQNLFDMYFCATAEKDLLSEVEDFPIKVLLDCCKLGLIKGEILIDLSCGDTLFQLIPMYKSFKDITILEVNDGCVEQMKKWRNKEIDSFDWLHAVNFVAKLEGTCASEDWKEMEDDLRERVKHILKCDLNNKNPTDPVILEKADCFINLYTMGIVSENMDEYSHKLKNMSTMLKKGGCLVLIGSFNGSYFTVNEQKYNIMNFTEKDLRKILKDNGFCIKHLEAMEKKSCVNLVSYGHIFVACAIKEID